MLGPPQSLATVSPTAAAPARERPSPASDPSDPPSAVWSASLPRQYSSLLACGGLGPLPSEDTAAYPIHIIHNHVPLADGGGGTNDRLECGSRDERVATVPGGADHGTSIQDTLESATGLTVDRLGSYPCHCGGWGWYYAQPYRPLVAVGIFHTVLGTPPCPRKILTRPARTIVWSDSKGTGGSSGVFSRPSMSPLQARKYRPAQPRSLPSISCANAM
jgi:hypothetical protein